MTHRSPIFEISDVYIDQAAELSPMDCTYLGNGLNQDKLDDFSLASAEKSADLIRETLTKLAAMEPIDEIDRIAKAVMIERLESGLALHDSQEAFVLWGVISSPPSNIRSIFELMPKSDDKDFENIAKRLAAVAGSYKSWCETIMSVAKNGKTTAQRQVTGVSEQLDGYANGGFSAMCKNFDTEGNYPAIHEAAKSAEKAAGETADFLRSTYFPIANPVDAVGADRYAVWARFFTGAKLDLPETYEWGKSELKAINERMWELAKLINPTAKSLREVADTLDNDPKYKVVGEENVVKYLQDFTDAAMKRLNGEFFEIDPRIAICEARLAPEGSASAPYYNPPSEDLSRPGTTWIPMLGKDEVSNWHLVSTWYHEAVPGHHLQVGTATIEKDRLSRFQRQAAWISGYGEGWALYAERFMNELGAFDEPGIEMGYLSAQALRAARIVVDIGMHLGYKDDNGEVWNAESSRKLLNEQALLDEDHSRSETDRYLGWPGQAISYKVGERVWMSAREDAKARLGDNFSIKKFHNYSLKLGPMGLDPFAAEMAIWQGQ